MPQPVDMQTELGRTIMAERIADAAGRASLASQQRTLLETEESRVKDETQVQESPETEGRNVNADGRRANPYVRRRKRKKVSKGPEQVFYTADEKKEIAEDPDDHELDVSI